MNAITATIPSAGASSYLASRAVIVMLQTPHWTGRRLDRKITDEINEAKNAAADAGRYNKSLLPKEALDPITKIIGETRNEFNRRTLPWIDTGARIMASEAHMAHQRWVGSQERKFWAAVDTFLAAYPGYVAQAPARLSGVFDASDYPDVSELRTKFGWKMETLPVPTSNDFRAAMSEAQAEHIRLQIEETVLRNTNKAVSDVYRRVAEVTERMVDRLNAYKPAKNKGQKTEGTFRDSLVENVRDLIDVLPQLNITGDPALTAMMGRLRSLVQHDAETLRNDPIKRRDVAAEAQAIFDSISGYIA